MDGLGGYQLIAPGDSSSPADPLALVDAAFAEPDALLAPSDLLAPTALLSPAEVSLVPADGLLSLADGLLSASAAASDANAASNANASGVADARFEAAARGSTSAALLESAPSESTAALLESASLESAADGNAPSLMAAAESTGQETRRKKDEVVQFLRSFSCDTYAALLRDKGTITGYASDSRTWSEWWHGLKSPSVHVKWREAFNGNPGDRLWPGYASGIEIRVPNDWTSAKVAQYLIEELDTDPDVQQALKTYDDKYDHNSHELGQVRESFKCLQDACAKIAAAVQPYAEAAAETAVSLLPGGTILLVTTKLYRGEYVGAAWDALSAIPFEKLAPLLGKATMAATGTILATLKFGDGKVLNIAVERLAQFQKLAKEVQAAIHGLIAKSKTADAALKILGMMDNPKLRETLAAGIGKFEAAWYFGIKSFRELGPLLAGTGLERHHLIPQRFAEAMGQRIEDMLCIALTPAEHLKFTNMWREEIAYGTTANRERILEKARLIYAEYPDILRALGL